MADITNAIQGDFIHCIHFKKGNCTNKKRARAFWGFKDNTCYEADSVHITCKLKENMFDLVKKSATSPRPPAPNRPPPPPAPPKKRIFTNSLGLTPKLDKEWNRLLDKVGESLK